MASYQIVMGMNTNVFHAVEKAEFAIGDDMTNWKSATCEKCVFRVERECRRFPQFKNVAEGYEYVTGPFQLVADFEVTGYQPACAEYTEPSIVAITGMPPITVNLPVVTPNPCTRSGV